MTLSERLARARATEATCQGCHVCKWGTIVPCPSQTEVWYAERGLTLSPFTRRALAGILPAKEYGR